MSKRTRWQRRQASHVAHTKVITKPSPSIEETNGQMVMRIDTEYQLLGYNWEEKWIASDDGEDGEWKPGWQEYALGTFSTLQETDQVAAKWRATIVSFG